jgi:hypothetical protein
MFWVSLVGIIALGFLAGRLMTKNDGYGHHHGGGYPSDERLKTDVEYVGTNGEGIRVYKFRYKGDDRAMPGVMAQEIREMPRFQHAVSEKNGYLHVDYSALGLALRSPEIMKGAGEAAIARSL